MAASSRLGRPVKIPAGMRWALAVQPWLFWQEDALLPLCVQLGSNRLSLSSCWSLTWIPALIQPVQTKCGSSLPPPTFSLHLPDQWQQPPCKNQQKRLSFCILAVAVHSWIFQHKPILICGINDVFCMFNCNLYSGENQSSGKKCGGQKLLKQAQWELSGVTTSRGVNYAVTSEQRHSRHLLCLGSSLPETESGVVLTIRSSTLWA